MRKIYLALLTGLLTAGMAVAQTATPPAPDNAPPPQKRHMGKGHHGGMHHQGYERMAQALNLSDQQKTQIDQIHQTQRQQVQAIRQDSSLTEEQKRDKIKQLRESTHQQVTALLTPEQQQKMDQLREQRKARGGPGMGDGMGPGGMGPMARLNLTPDQKSQMQPIFQSARQQAQAVRQDTTLTQEQKRDKLRSIHQNAMSQAKSILTPEQQQQLQQMRERRGGKHGPPPGDF